MKKFKKTFREIALEHEIERLRKMLLQVCIAGILSAVLGLVFIIVTALN